MNKEDFKNISLDGFQLKMIAVVAMLCNHIGLSFQLSQNHPLLFNLTEIIGKLTFPIMAFLLVEGFHYTRNKKKYAFRLLLFGIISIYPFHWLHYPLKSFISPIELVNNIFFTLLMGLLLIWSYSNAKNKLVRVIIVIFFSLITIASDFNIIGPLIIFGFYIIKDKRKKIMIPIVSMSVFMLIIYTLVYFFSSKSILTVGILLTILSPLLNIPLLFFYNGNRGRSNSFIKWGFYWFYPFHLTLLAFLRYLILGW
ncbi:fimbrial assembly protein fimC [Vagococcus fluvialis]|uniref:TraX family protein n=1 Tax=Vagococcus fluvialis TaxID=2738 RepID=UPI001A8F7459|nr:TraX family protein [Vagococcus fluvialis]MBO0428372.1 fimbrial assembly protein fimC [Vagococcus fluvialis]